jgi:hypothetical protein
MNHEYSSRRMYFVPYLSEEYFLEGVYKNTRGPVLVRYKFV